MTAATITWQRGFVNRFVGRVIRDANQRLYQSLDALIRARGCPVAQRSLAAAKEYEQRFGGKTCFGGKLASFAFDTAPSRLSLLAAYVRAVMQPHREGNSRAAGSGTRTTGSGGKKTASGSGGTDPDPERPHAYNPATTGLDAASFGGAA